MISQSSALVGKIVPSGGLTAQMSAPGSLIGSLSKPSGYADYTESYEVTPKVTKQSLKTKDKHMTNDVTIKKIPFFNVSNEAGGSTAYIGSEV